MSPLAAVRLALGSVALVQPRRLQRLWCGGVAPRRVLLVGRVLGARHLLQGAVVATHPTRTVREVSTGIDALHALSMVALAAVSPRHRRPAVTSAGVAAGFASLTALELRRGGDAPPTHRRAPGGTTDAHTHRLATHGPA